MTAQRTIQPCLHFIRFLLVWALLFTIAPHALADIRGKHPVSFVIAPDVLASYQEFLHGRQIKNVLDINANLPRDTLETFITLYSLHLGGLDYYPEYVTTPSLERHIALLRSGNVAMSAALIDQLDSDSAEGIHNIPSPFPKSDRIVGLFTAPGNEHALKAHTRDAVRALTAISNKSWRADWQALETIGLNGLISVADWTAMSRMVLAGRGDFLLAPRQPRSNAVLETPAGTLVQMKPFGIRLHINRQFALSKKHPDYQKLKAALKSGLRQIGSDHFIQDAINQLETERGRQEILIILNDPPHSSHR